MAVASAAAYAFASIELLARLWLKFDELSMQLAAVEPHEMQPEAEMQLVILRLELLILLDACDCSRWHSLLAREHRLELRSLVQDLLNAIAVPDDRQGWYGTVQAQNQLLEAILRRCSEIRLITESISEI